MSIEVRIEGDSAIVGVVADDCAGIWPAVEEQLGSAAKHCILDFSAVTYLNSMNIAAIISLHKKVGNAGGKLALACISDNIRSVFRVLKLERMFDLELDLAGAQTAVNA